MSTNPFATTDGFGRNDVSVRDTLLFALTISSGAVDAISFISLGKVFTAFMTGNIAFLGLALAQDPSAPSIFAILASMAGFAVGIYIATRIVAPPGSSVATEKEQSVDPLWSRRITYALGLSLLPHLCFALLWSGTNAQPGPIATLALLALWALAMGMQSGAARRLNVSGVFTTAATATFIFLVGDFANKPLTGEERRRLTGVLVSLAIGATAGSLLLVHVPLYAPLLPFVLTLAIVATAARVFDNHHHRTASQSGRTQS